MNLFTAKAACLNKQTPIFK